MKTEETAFVLGKSPAAEKADSAKLISLLALAAGAASMPQLANADVIVQSANTTVGSAPSDDTLTYNLNLPNSHLTIGVLSSNFTTADSLARITYKDVRFSSLGAPGYGKVQVSGKFAVIRGKSEAWNNGASSQFSGIVGRAMWKQYFGAASATYQTFPAGFSNHYLAFRFKDNGLASGNWLYGWVEVSMTYIPGFGPSVTIGDYAYDPSGGQVAIGTPEPNSSALLALGALALGARGVRNWRRNRPEKTS